MGPCDLGPPFLIDIDESQRVEATLQAFQMLPEENYLVLRFLTAFLVQVRPRPGPLPLTWRREGGVAVAAAPGRGCQAWEAASLASCCSPLIPSTDFCPL